MAVNFDNIKAGDLVTVEGVVDEIRDDTMFIKITGDYGKRAFMKKTHALSHTSVNMLKGDTVYDTQGDVVEIKAIEFDAVLQTDVAVLKNDKGEVMLEDLTLLTKERPSR